MTIIVAVALIVDSNAKILIAQRPLAMSHGGEWEFPGGKVEANETVEAALIREVKEEVGLTVEKCELLTVIEHAYPQRNVCLHFYLVSNFSGIALQLENQPDLRWVLFEDLKSFSFPGANKKFINWLVSSKLFDTISPILI